MSVKIFVEYKIKSGREEAFAAATAKIKSRLEQEGAAHVAFYEGVDQPGLVVEEYIVANMSVYDTIKSKRLEQQDPFWDDIHGHIDGGAKKVNIWAFRPITT